MKKHVEEKNRKITMGITLERWLWKNIDKERGDVNRSLFIRNIIKEHMDTNEVIDYNK